MLNIDNPYFEQIACHMYPTEFKLNKAHFDTETPFQGLLINNSTVSSKITINKVNLILK